MSEQVLDLQIDGCIEETAPPITLKVNGNGGKEIFKAVMQEPTYREWTKAWVTIEEVPAELRGAYMVTVCMKSWSLDVPITPENIVTLYPAIQDKLAEIVLAISDVKAAQRKNSSSPLTSSSTSKSTE